MPAYIPRRAEALVNAALEDTRVVSISGARQAGKSTLVARVVRDRKNTLTRRLDVGVERAAAERDPQAFVRRDGLLVIDEIQRVPELVLAIKPVVDEDPRPGRFLLTGSVPPLRLVLASSRSTKGDASRKVASARAAPRPEVPGASRAPFSAA